LRALTLTADQALDDLSIIASGGRPDEGGVEWRNDVLLEEMMRSMRSS
jgi:hypothetical protein